MQKQDQAADIMRILVVDDSEDSRDITEALLHSAGYGNVVAVGSAADAFSYLDIGVHETNGVAPVETILLDILMPDIDGIEACARIRSDTRYGDVPIIMVTSLADMDSLSNAFVAGANDYITKPINHIELLARLRAALKLKAELERRKERERELLGLISNRGGARATSCIDDVTGLFVSEVAEAYLNSTSTQFDGEPLSVLALTVDRLDACRAAQGEAAASLVLARVAKAVRAVAANVGVIAAAYRNGLIVIIAPGRDARTASRMGEAIRASVARLNIANSESIAADHVTVSIAVATGAGTRQSDRIACLTQTIRAIQKAANGRGDRVFVIPTSRGADVVRR